MATASTISSEEHRVASPGLPCPLPTDVPPEILVEVFSWLCNNFTVLQRRAGPWTLAQVCRRWRHVVLGTPLLWSSFNIRVSHSEAFSDSASYMLQRVLELGASAPLYIDCDLDRIDPPITRRTIIKNAGAGSQRVLDLLVAQAERWREIVLQISPHLVPSLDRLSSRLPLLRGLQLGLTRKVQGDLEMYPHTTGFIVAPQLANVTLTKLLFERVSLPLHSLKTLRLAWKWEYQNEEPPRCQYGTSFQRLHYLTDCPTLSSLDIVHWFDNEMNPRAPWSCPPLSPPLIHHHLSTLRVSDVRFIRSVTLPSLRHLAIVDRLIKDASPPFVLTPLLTPCPSMMLAAVTGLLERSECPLESLLLPDVTDTASLLKLAHLAPHLESLTIHYAFWGRDADLSLIALFAEMTHQSVLPRLRSLDIGSTKSPLFDTAQASQSDIIHFVGSGFGQFVRSRWLANDGMNVARLERVSVEIQCRAILQRTPSSLTLLDELRGFKADGLEVSIVAGGTMALLEGPEPAESYSLPLRILEWARRAKHGELIGMIYV